MPEEYSERVVRLLEEIRDLTKERNEKLDTLVQSNRQRTEEIVKRQVEQQKQAKKRFYLSVAAVFILGVMLFIVSLLLMTPRQ